MQVGTQASYYTVQFDGQKQTEAEKFLTNPKVKNESEFNDLWQRYRNMRDRHSCEFNNFRHEGRDRDMVMAMPDKRIKTALRWYCVWWSRRLVIWGNGGIKNVRATQDDPYLKQCEQNMRWVGNCIEKRDDFDTFKVDIDTGEILSELYFNAENF